MPKLDAFVPVDAELQTIWRVLLDRIENPDRYTSGVEKCEFIENTDDYAIRDLSINGMVLRERISIDEAQGEVRYQLVDHPLYAGDVINALIPADEKDLKAKHVVQFRMNWEPLTSAAKTLDSQSHATIEEGLKQGVHYVRDLAEHLQKSENESETAKQP
jgi:hypothetical protein